MAATRPPQMNPTIAIPAPRRLSDLLSSPLRHRVKAKRDVKEQQARADEDAPLPLDPLPDAAAELAAAANFTGARSAAVGA